MLTEEDKEDLAERFAQKLQQGRYVSEKKHREHHDWLDAKIAADKKRKEFWEAVFNKLVEQGVTRAFWLMIVLTLLGFIAWFKGLITWPGS